MNSSDDAPPKRTPPTFEIEEGPTMDRFFDLTRRLLHVNRSEVKQKEEEWKKARRKRRSEQRNAEKKAKAE